MKITLTKEEALDILENHFLETMSECHNVQIEVEGLTVVGNEDLSSQEVSLRPTFHQLENNIKVYNPLLYKFLTDKQVLEIYINNCLLYNEPLNDHLLNAELSIFDAFYWEDTLEGFDYWNKLNNEFIYYKNHKDIT